MFRLSAVVILFHPDETCSNNIKTYLEHVENAYIIDNSPQKSILSAEIMQSPKVKYFSDLENKGIAARLNFALQLAASDGHDWLLTMDQDSAFDDPMLYNYKNCVDDFVDKKNVAVFGIEHEKKILIQECQFSDVANLITSGSIVNIEIVERIGKFDEDLFIDEVDFEYCYRAKKNGFRIVKFENIFLSHRIGEQSNFRSLKNLKVTKRALHSPMRTYYMIRNHFYVQKKYGKLYPDVFQKRKKDVLTSVKNNLIYGKNRWQTLLAIIQGYNDYRRAKFGKKS